jgi:formate C-acetyltransferase
VKHYGVSKKDAADYIHSTCAEITVCGKSKGHTCSFIMDLPRLLVQTVRLSDGFGSFDELFDAYIAALTKNAKEQSLHYALRILESARVGNEPLRSCALVDDCIARGKSFYEGGERYTFNQPILVGFGTVVDSLVAIAKLVYEEKSLSLKELDTIVADNYANDERLRGYILNKLPHYGNDDDFADGMASRFAASLQKMFETSNASMWEYMQPGTFSYINHALLGRDMGPTYDGRLAHVSYSDGCGAVQGRDVCGPTAMILSLTSYDQSKFLGGMVVNVKFGKHSLDGEKAKNLVSMVRTFMERGGVEMQINVVDRKTLEDARENPEAHRDLIVRIGGYSDYFTRLAPVLQQEIIDRTEY